MAATGSRRKPLTYAISYGLGGGPAHARKFKRLMGTAGFMPASHIKTADIILAHSAGCWLVPDEARPKLLIYIGMPLSQAEPSRTWREAKKSMIRHNHRATRLKVELLNSYYGVRQPRRNLRIIRMSKTAQPVVASDAATVFIANRHDPWPRAEVLQDYLKTNDWAFIGLPGAHDDVWEHPDRYVEVIKHYAGLLG